VSVVVTAHYTYTGPRELHKPGVHVDPRRPELLASVMTTPRLAAARAFVLGAALLLASAAQAGWLIVDENGDHTLLSRGRLKMVSKQADTHSMVLDLTRARLWVAHAGQRLYWEGTVEEYCAAVRSAMPAVDARMTEQLKELPPAQREQMEQLMKQMGRGAAAGPPPKVTIERTAETETIAALPTRKYRVLVNGKLYEELWLTTDAAFLRELDLARAPDTFGRMFACGPGAGGDRVEASAEYRQLFARGWPLKAVYHGNGGGPGRALVTRVEPLEVPERDLTPPAGFRPAPLSEVFGR
jgi:hypothetical protein